MKSKAKLKTRRERIEALLNKCMVAVNNEDYKAAYPPIRQAVALITNNWTLHCERVKVKSKNKGDMPLMIQCGDIAFKAHWRVFRWRYSSLTKAAKSLFENRDHSPYLKFRIVDSKGDVARI